MTPFDAGRVLWYTTPGSVPDQTALAMIARLRDAAPNLTGVLFKAWNWDSWALRSVAQKPRAIAGQADVRYWVDLLHASGLKAYAWGVARGERVAREAALLQQVAGSGVDGVVVDVEVGEYYWRGNAAGATTLARALSETGVHVGLCFDYRGTHAVHSNAIQWMPFAGSLHPMAYHWHFQRPAASVMAEMSRTLAPLEIPIVPALQGYSLRGRPYLANDIPVTARLALGQPGVVGVSWFRYGRGLTLGTEDGIGPGDLAQIAAVDPWAPQVPAEPVLFSYTDALGAVRRVVEVRGRRWRLPGAGGWIDAVPLRAA